LLRLAPDADAEVTVTSGASEAIFDAVAAVVRAGEEVIVLDPCYDCYEPAIELAGGVAVHVPLDPQTFAPDWDAVRAAITPAHPDAHDQHAAQSVRRHARRRRHGRRSTSLLHGTGIWLLSDEVYEHIVFDGARHESVLRHQRLRERAFVISSFGKTYHCTGWKVGYCIAPPAMSTEFRKVHQYNTFCSFTPAQYAFAAMIDAEPEHYEQLGAFYQAKRDHFREQLLTTKLKPLPVPGGYFQLVDYSAVSDLTDLAFCRWLTSEHGVAAIRYPRSTRSRPQASAWRGCVSRRTRRRWMRRSSGCRGFDRKIHAGPPHLPRPGRDPLARSGRQPRLLRAIDVAAERRDRPGPPA
jgi:methionine aminotransferase